MNLAGKTITGKRSHNEDSYFAGVLNGTPVVAVSDGMGGHAAGETASRISIETLCAALEQARPVTEGSLVTAFSKANGTVYDTAVRNEAMYGMGATLVCAVLSPTRFLAANVGDSRLYLFHGGSIRQISHDHSYVAELVRRGIITPEEAKTHPRRNLITRAVGTEPTVRTDLFSDAWEPGDILLLCSDGLSGSLSEAEMAYLLLSTQDLDKACTLLIDRAFENGSTDNITVVLARNAEDAK